MLWRRARQYTNILILNFNFNLAGHQDETLADDNIKQFLLECKKWLSVYKNSKHECANYNCKSRYKKGGVTGVLPIWIVSLTFTSVGSLSEKNISLANARNVRLTTYRIGSTPTFLYFDLYLNTVHAAQGLFQYANYNRWVLFPVVLVEMTSFHLFNYKRITSAFRRIQQHDNHARGFGSSVGV